jgi:hypothetical protein
VNESPAQPEATLQPGPEETRVPADLWWAFVDAAAARWQSLDEEFGAALAEDENRG